MNKKKVVFLGHYSYFKNRVDSVASSSAGDLVQKRIFSDLSNVNSISCIHQVLMEPHQVWPRGKLWINTKKDQKSNTISVGYLNLPVVKNLMYSLYFLLYIYRTKPDYIVQYNSYLFENIFVLISSFFKTRSIMVLQDYRVGSMFKKTASLHDRIAGYLVKSFDFIMPVSDFFAEKLNLRNEKYLIVKGGKTSFGTNDGTTHATELVLENKAVYAGALEKHNGLDKLLKFWVDNSIDFPLHIYGDGSLRELVITSSKINCNIIFHGKVEQHTVHEAHRSAKFNFCLRYSIGLDERYFFPSKFFNVAECKGLMICNDFYGLPDDLTCDKACVLDEGFSNFFEILSLSDEYIEQIGYTRLKILEEKYTWRSQFETVFKSLG